MSQHAYWRELWMRRWLPYLLTGWNGRVLLEHREYLPVGNHLRPPVAYVGEWALVDRGAMDVAALLKTSKTEHGWLYNDSCQPWRSAACLRRYAARTEAAFRGMVPERLAKVLAMARETPPRNAWARAVFEERLARTWGFPGTLELATPYTYDGRRMDSLTTGRNLYTGLLVEDAGR